MLNLRRFSIFQRFAMLVGIVIFGLIVLSVSSLNNQYKALKYEQYLKTQNVVETAYSIIEHFHTLEQNNTLTQQQAQTQAMNAIRALRYDKTNYFWINNYQPEMVMHPIKPALEGKDLTKFTNQLINKVTQNLEKFHYNVIVANLYEMYNFLIKETDKPIKKEILIENYKKVWDNQSEDSNKASSIEIYKIAQLRSTSIVKWIFIIDTSEGMLPSISVNALFPVSGCYSGNVTPNRLTHPPQVQGLCIQPEIR